MSTDILWEIVERWCSQVELEQPVDFNFWDERSEYVQLKSSSILTDTPMFQFKVTFKAYTGTNAPVFALQSILISKMCVIKLTSDSRSSCWPARMLNSKSTIMLYRCTVKRCCVIPTENSHTHFMKGNSERHWSPNPTLMNLS
jgi:hypothetical protein